MIWYRTGMAVQVAGVLVAIGGAAYAGGGDEHGHGEEAAGHSHDKSSAHGGSVTMTKQFHFEAVFLPKELRVYVYSYGQDPMLVKRSASEQITGKVTVQFRSRNKKPIKLELQRAVSLVPSSTQKKGGHEEHGEHKHREHEDGESDHGEHHGEPAHGKGEAGAAKGPGAVLWVCRPQDYLMAKVDLSKMKPNSAKVTFVLKNLPSKKERQITF